MFRGSWYGTVKISCVISGSTAAGTVTQPNWIYDSNTIKPRPNAFGTNSYSLIGSTDKKNVSYDIWFDMNTHGDKTIAFNATSSGADWPLGATDATYKWSVSFYEWIPSV